MSAAGLWALAGLLVAAGYVGLVLPRMPQRWALPLTALLAAASAAAGLASGAAWAAALPATALLFGHLGWHLATRARSAPSLTAATIAPPEAAPRAATTLPPEPDRSTLGRYRIDRQIGRGAMGAVYLGNDPKIGRPVAIKTLALSQEFAGEALAEARERFFREAETAGRLQHRDIVTIFDAGEDQELAYIAMEYVPGHDLQRHTLAGRLLPLADVLQIVARVAQALAHAHTQGVVHRDIKPGNVMIEPRAGTVKVTDFGIARITDASRTRTGMVLGTPSYMSPEQMAGRRVDGRSDLYSLGVVLFQLLTGALPHHSESMAKLMYQIANEPAPDVRSLRPELPEALANVVALALEKRPEVRYADGLQFAEDLQAIATLIAPQPAPGTPSPPAEQGAEPPAQTGAFDATVRFSRADPRHNSGP